MPIREKMPKEPSGGQLLPPHVPSHAQTAAKVRGFSPIASGFTAETDWLLEGDGFEPSVPRVMDGELGRQVPALLAVFELAGTAVALQSGTRWLGPPSSGIPVKDS